MATQQLRIGWNCRSSPKSYYINALKNVTDAKDRMRLWLLVVGRPKELKKNVAANMCSAGRLRRLPPLTSFSSIVSGDYQSVLGVTTAGIGSPNRTPHHPHAQSVY
jgi:hypothetical protein